MITWSLVILLGYYDIGVTIVINDFATRDSCMLALAQAKENGSLKQMCLEVRK